MVRFAVVVVVLGACGSPTARPTDAAVVIDAVSAVDAAVAVDGTVAVDAAQIQLSASPASKDFGHLRPELGMPTTFTITNLGSVPTGTLTVALGGVNASAFQLGTSTCGASLAAGATCTVDVAPAPMQAGLLVAVLTVSAPGGSVDVPLTESCCAPPGLTITPATHDFGSQSAGTTGAAYAFTITNDGATTTGMIAPQLAGIDATEFTIAGTTCTTLANLVSCTVSVAFAPSTAGAKSASLTISAAPGGVATAVVTGTGL